MAEEKERLYAPFDDTPDPRDIEKVVSVWARPSLPDAWQSIPGVSPDKSIAELSQSIRNHLGGIRNVRQRSRLEDSLIGWLYDLVRANVKRGRVFDLGEVLQKGSADCLGYCKLLTLLGRQFGLDIGIVEIIRDNAGRLVPHTVCLVKLASGRHHFVDPWYGSKNIKHKRIGLRVKRGTEWKVEDLELEDLKKQEAISYLPDHCVDAITAYIRGNRCLNQKDFVRAVEHYSRAIQHYPTNARLYYNRAVALESLGEYDRAKADYAQALSSKGAQLRTMATEHEEITSLIDLDTAGIYSQAQGIYLLHQGFVTGKRVSLSRIANKFHLSEAEVRGILTAIEAKMESTTKMRLGKGHD